jgi:hypothetical protein
MSLNIIDNKILILTISLQDYFNAVKEPAGSFAVLQTDMNLTFLIPAFRDNRSHYGVSFDMFVSIIC